MTFAAKGAALEDEEHSCGGVTGLKFHLVAIAAPPDFVLGPQSKAMSEERGGCPIAMRAENIRDNARMTYSESGASPEYSKRRAGP